MSKAKLPENSNGSKITARDLFGSIPKPIDVDPFEGIDMEAINVLRRPLDHEDEGVAFDEFNRLRGYDIADLSAGTSQRTKLPKKDDLISLEGVDTDFIGLAKKSGAPNGSGAQYQKELEKEGSDQAPILEDERSFTPENLDVLADHEEPSEETAVEQEDKSGPPGKFPDFLRGQNSLPGPSRLPFVRSQKKEKNLPAENLMIARACFRLSGLKSGVFTPKSTVYVKTLLTHLKRPMKKRWCSSAPMTVPAIRL